MQNSDAPFQLNVALHRIPEPESVVEVGVNIRPQRIEHIRAIEVHAEEKESHAH
jgi:hypothetical protein